VLVLAVLVAYEARGQARVGGEFQVNAFTTFGQSYGEVVYLGPDFLVVWTSGYQDGAGNGVFARFYSSAGVAVASEFQVNTYTPGQQRAPAVAAETNGDFVVVWQSKVDYEFIEVVGRRFSSLGMALDDEFQVSTYTGANQFGPAIAADADGDLVVVWQRDAGDGSEYGLFGRRLSSDGVALGDDFQVNSYTTSMQSYPAVAARTDGDFVVVWQSRHQDGGNGYYDLGIFGRRFTSAGEILAVEFQVNVYTLSSQSRPSVAADGDGDFIVVWSSYGQDDGYYEGVFGRRFSSTGAVLIDEFQVNAQTVLDQDLPQVAVEADGDFVVTWRHYTEVVGLTADIVARRFASSGSPSSGDFQVNTHTTGYQSDPSLAIRGDGSFVVVWRSEFQDGSLDGVFGQRFVSGTVVATATFTATASPTATATASTTPTRTSTPTGSVTPTLTRTSTPTGSATPTSTSTSSRTPTPSATSTSSPTRTLTPTPSSTPTRTATATPTNTSVTGLAVLDVDGDGEVLPLTDGLLLLRWLFGFSGATLIGGAVDGSDCTRCTAGDVDGYIAGLGLQIDADGDGELVPLTDGLLILRYLFGFSGLTLTNGAVDTSDCSRCDAAAIAGYLGTLD
jgi:hypothetical protein